MDYYLAVDQADIDSHLEIQLKAVADSKEAVVTINDGIKPNEFIDSVFTNDNPDKDEKYIAYRTLRLMADQPIVQIRVLAEDGTSTDIHRLLIRVK